MGVSCRDGRWISWREMMADIVEGKDEGGRGTDEGDGRDGGSTAQSNCSRFGKLTQSQWPD